MRSKFGILTITLVLMIAATACIASGGEPAGHTQPAQRLDPATWPTPQPSPTPAPPTPFPKITLAPTATPTPRPPTVMNTPTPAARERLTFTGGIDSLVQQVIALSGGLPPVAAATIQSDSVTIRQGPASSYAWLGTAKQGELAAILGKNASGDWWYVLTESALQGWLPTSAVQINFSLGAAPTLPADILTQESPQAASSISVPVNPLDGLEPVAAFLVTAKSATIRQGPAATYPGVAPVEQGELGAVLGTNAAQDWLYVITLSVVQGWLPTDAVRVTGSLAGAPVLPANPLAVNTPLSASPSATASILPNSVPGQPLALSELKPVITASVDNDALNIRQGPGAAYEQIGTLWRADQVMVLALNKTGDWALVRTTTGQFGWVSLAYLAVDGTLDSAPRVISPAPGRDLPSGQVAPVYPAPDAASGKVTSANRQTGIAPVGRLVFQLSSGGDIMVINPDGTGLRRLTHGIDPVLSPDGQTVAFTRWTGEDGVLWLISIDGSNERPVLGGTKQAKHPAWSPDGQRLVINFQDGGRLDPKQICENLIELRDRNPGIPWNVDPDTVKVEIKNRRPYLCWTLPPDPHWGLRVVNLADGSFMDVPSDTYAFGPEWDPVTPWRIISSGLEGLVQLDVNRVAQWALTDRGEDHTPRISPDGRYIAVAFNNNGHYNIHRLNRDGGERMPLTKTPLWVTAGSGEQRPWNNVSPAWSPDSSQIAFLTDRRGRWEIWVMNADGSDQRPMFTDTVNDQLSFRYDFVDERMLSWR